MTNERVHYHKYNKFMTKNGRKVCGHECRQHWICRICLHFVSVQWRHSRNNGTRKKNRLPCCMYLVDRWQSWQRYKFQSRQPCSSAGSSHNPHVDQNCPKKFFFYVHRVVKQQRNSYMLVAGC